MSKVTTKFFRFLKIFGPGVITGAADDDPSGIATYTQTGAKFGYGQLWTVIVMLPLMTAIQEACARIGAVTGHGLAAVIKTNRKLKSISKRTDHMYGLKVQHSVFAINAIVSMLNFFARNGP